MNLPLTLHYFKKRSLDVFVSDAQHTRGTLTRSPDCQASDTRMDCSQGLASEGWVPRGACLPGSNARGPSQEDSRGPQGLPQISRETTHIYCQSCVSPSFDQRMISKSVIQAFR